MIDWQSLGLISGTTLLGLAGLRTLGFAGTIFLRRKGQVASRIDGHQAFIRQLQTVLHWARASQPSFQAWPGTRRLKVADVVTESARCKSFYLMPIDGRPLARFEPGQYLTFHLPIGHSNSTQRQRPLVRCYSLSDRPREEHYRITIKHVLAPESQSNLPAGLASSYFHNHVHSGTILDVQAPQGAFFLDPTDQSSVVLVGAGIGVTPLLSIASTIAYQSRGRRAHLFFGFRNSHEHPLRGALRDLVAEQPNIGLDVSYSQPLAEDRIGIDYDQHDHVNIKRLQQKLPSNNFHFYVCGPATMMENLVAELLAWGVPRSHVHFEAFGPSSVDSLTSTDEMATVPCDVEFALSNSTLHWDGTHRSLLELGQQGGVELQSGCRAGSCGQCLLRIRSGQVAHCKEPSIPLAEGECLACIAVPQGYLVLDA